VDRDLEKIQKALEDGKMTRESFKARIRGLIDKAYESKMKTLFDGWMNERERGK